MDFQVKIGNYFKANESFIWDGKHTAQLEHGQAGWWGAQGGAANNNRMMMIGCTRADFSSALKELRECLRSSGRCAQVDDPNADFSSAADSLCTSNLSAQSLPPRSSVDSWGFRIS